MEKYDFYKRTNLKSSASKDLLNQSISNEKVSDEKVLNRAHADKDDPEAILIMVKFVEPSEP